MTTFWTRLTKIAVILSSMLLCAVTASFAIVLMQNWRQYESLKETEMRLQSRLSQVKQELRIKKQYYELLCNDPDFIERIARQKLGYAHPNEIIFRFEDAEETGK